MTQDQLVKTINKIVSLEKDIDALKLARLEAATSGFASASISSVGGSKTYTRLSPSQITSLIKELRKELAQLRNMLYGREANPLKSTYIIYS